MSADFKKLCGVCLVLSSLLALLGIGSLAVAKRVRDARYTVAPEFFAARAAGEPGLHIEHIVVGRNEIAHPDTVRTVRLKHGDELSMTGWCVDEGSQQQPAGLVVQIDRFDQIASTYGEPREEVAAGLRDARFLYSGFFVDIAPRTLATGTHELAFKLLKPGATAYIVSPRRIDVVVAP